MSHRLRVAFASLLALLLVVVAVVVFFPWDLLREPINRYVSKKTGREFAITQKLEVDLGLTTRVRMIGLRFANPDWARDAQLIEADSVDVDVALLPLLKRSIELPVVALHNPRLAMQMQPDGRRSWAFGKDTGDPANLPHIGTLLVDNGGLSFLAEDKGADVKVAFTLSEAVDGMPLQYKAQGKWQGQPFTAQGRTGNVMTLTEVGHPVPFPIEVKAQAARTRLEAAGSIGSLATLEGIDATFDLHGNSLGDLYKVVGVVLPHTPPYAVKGRLTKQGPRWQVTQMQGRLGTSDIGGDLAFEQKADKPLLTGNVRSRVLDMDDLGPLFGAAPAGKSADPAAVKPVAAVLPGETGTTATASKTSASVAQRPGKVLPTAPLDFERLAAMNADVTYTAASIRHVQAVPLDQGSVHVVLKDSVLALDPLTLRVAGGRVQGRVNIDAQNSPALVRTNLDVRNLALNQMFPTVEKMKGSLGSFNGHLQLDGRGNSVAQWLGASSGEVQLLTGQGRMSNMLLEMLGLDAGEMIKFFVRGDREVQLRCAAVSFDVKKGLMTSHALVLDTSDTVVYGAGAISLANESIDITLKPQPKDMSILSLRSPLKIGGTFASPSAGIDKGALAGRAGLAVALAVVNPLLALAATVETGPGKDADCAAALKGKAISEPVESLAAAPAAATLQR